MDEACRLVQAHEESGDSISYFDVNVALYFQREGWDETERRSQWGYRRLAPRAQEIVKRIDHEDKELARLLRELIQGSVNGRLPGASAFPPPC